MTQKDFKSYPLNLSPWHVRQVLGCSEQELRTLRQQHPEIVARQCGRGKYFYRKEQIALLGKISYE